MTTQKQRPNRIVMTIHSIDRPIIIVLLQREWYRVANKDEFHAAGFVPSIHSANIVKITKNRIANHTVHNVESGVERTKS
jgi:hypothetical protein